LPELILVRLVRYWKRSATEQALGNLSLTSWHPSQKVGIDSLQGIRLQ
jgi:hypothetical protein